MSSFDWENFLRQWSQAILESMGDAEKQQLPQEVLDSGWLGHAGATEDQITRVETRLRVKLAPSYRDFLKVTNGWRQTAPQSDSFNYRLWSTDDIERFAVRHPQWIQSFTEHHETADISLDDPHELDDQWEPIGISDDDYFVYGESQDPSKIRAEYLKTAIEISDVGVGSIYLLNPQVVTSDGEWEAWLFADYLPGADRYRSFRDMMEAEYLNFLELQTSETEASEAATTNGTQTSSEQVAVDEPDFSLDFELADGPKITADGPRIKSDTSSALTASTEPIAWQSLKRLTVEFQTRQVNNQGEYRTVVSSGGLSHPQAWQGLTEGKLRLWLQQNLADAEKADLIEPPRAPVSTASFATKSGIPSLLTHSGRPSSENTVPSPVNEVEETQKQKPPLEINLEIARLAIRQPSNPAAQIVIRPTILRRFKQVGISSLFSHQPFSIEVEFHLSGQCMDNAVFQDVHYRVLFFAQNRTTHQWLELGKTLPNALERGRFTYAATLFDQTLTSGMYRMQVLTSLSGVAMALSSFELPLLNVI